MGRKLMPLVPLAHVAQERASARAGLGAFNVIHLENAEAFVRAAERAGQPVVLQISQNAATYHGALAPISLGTLEVARRAEVPVVVHLDHAEDLDLVYEAIDLGFTSIMYDGSALDYDDNVRNTAEVVCRAHGAGISVEAELGKVGGKDGVHAPGVRTDPTEAAAFVASTGVDALAVAVGTSHAMTTRDAALDLELIAAMREALPVPLVLHGSSGVSDEGMVAAIRAGMTKINVSTHLNKIFTAQVREYLDENPAVVDSRKYFARGMNAVGDEVARLLSLYAAP